METKLESMRRQYSRLPKELRELKRWVGFWKTDRKIHAFDKEITIPAKCPLNALTGKTASSTNPLSWTSFEVALNGCIKYGFDGLGFMLGNGIFGVDLDNHPDQNGSKPMSDSDFSNLANEFIKTLNSYSERSQSGDGVHILCKGKLPSGARRKEGTGVEMYDDKRYFAMTGNVINDKPIEFRENEIKTLWEKYLKTEVPVRTRTQFFEDGSVRFGNFYDRDMLESSFQTMISDNDLIERIKSSKNAQDFMSLYFDGDLNGNKGDHSAADLSLCTILAFWTNKNRDQMDRIFRTSALMRPKWDRKLGESTYGAATIDKAINTTIDTYTPPKKKEVSVYFKPVQANNIVSNNNETESNIDENGDPIVGEVKKSFKKYSLDDTGNAERYYSYFGHLFKYDSKNKAYLFWNNKTWVYDSAGYAKKYADELIKLLKSEADAYEKTLEEVTDPDVLKKKNAILKEMRSNVSRLSNKAGKEAMLSELQHLHKMPCEPKHFNTQPYLLNTLSGVVDLRTGEIMPFDPKLMLSKNTNCKVSYEEPKVFLKFLHDIFQGFPENDIEEIIEYLQKFYGKSITGRSDKDIGIFWGEGSNGKSTLVQTMKMIFGDYGQVANPDMLMQDKKGGGQATEFSLALLAGARYVTMSETGETDVLKEQQIKRILSDEEITAQFKGKDGFQFLPTWMTVITTNHKPLIRATDHGTWRRIHFIPFQHIFTDAEKDIHMKEKLLAEAPKILGWIIQGSVKLINQEKEPEVLKKPKCLEEALADYKNEMDVLNSYLSERTQNFAGYETSAKKLFDDYKEWAKDGNEYLMSSTKFGREIAKHGYTKKRTRNGYVYVGVKLLTDTKGKIFSIDPLED